MCDHRECLELLASTVPRDPKTLDKIRAWDKRYGVFPDQGDSTSLYESLTVRRGKEGDVLYRQNDVARRYLILHEGQVRLYRTRGLKRDLGAPVREVAPGEGFGEEPFLVGLERHTTSAVVVSEECVLLEVPGPVYLRTLADKHAQLVRRRQMERHLRTHFGALFGSSLDEATLDAMTTRELSPGDVLCESGSLMTDVYFVARGDLILTAQFQDGETNRRFQVTRCGRGAIIGDVEALENCDRYLTTATATELTTVYAIARTAFHAILDASPSKRTFARDVQCRRSFHAARALAAIKHARKRRPSSIPVTSVLDRRSSIRDRVIAKCESDTAILAAAPPRPATMRIDAANRALLALHRLPSKQRARTPNLCRLVTDILLPYTDSEAPTTRPITTDKGRCPSKAKLRARTSQDVGAPTSDQTTAKSKVDSKGDRSVGRSKDPPGLTFAAALELANERRRRLCSLK